MSARTSNRGLKKVLDAISAAVEKVRSNLSLNLPAVVVGLAMFTVYLIGCKACSDLCRRAGSPSSIAVWQPLFKRLALFKAVGISRVWFFLGFIPLVGFWAWVRCCLRLCETFRRSKWWVWPMLNPFIAPLVFISFAQSSREDDQEPALRKPSERAMSLEGIIAGDLPLRVLKKTYADAVAGLMDYGKLVQRQYNAERYIDCELCKTKPTSELQGYLWIARIRPRFSFSPVDLLLSLFGFVGINLRGKILEFETTQFLCRWCVKKTRMDRAVSVAVKGLAFFVLLVSLGATIAGLTATAYIFNSKAEWDMRYVWTSVFGFGGLIAGWIGHKLERMLRIPAPFRTIARYPFSLSKVRLISTAGDRAKAFQHQSHEEFSTV